MSVGAQDMLPLLVEEGHEPLIVFVEIAPEREFRLQVDPQLVGGLEGSLWRAPRMETDVVDAILAVFREIVHPFGSSHRHMGLEGEDAGIVLATEEYLAAIGHEMVVIDTEVDEAEGRGQCVLPVDRHLEGIAGCGVVLVPHLRLLHVDHQMIVAIGSSKGVTSTLRWVLLLTG